MGQLVTMATIQKLVIYGCLHLKQSLPSVTVTRKKKYKEAPLYGSP